MFFQLNFTSLKQAVKESNPASGALEALPYPVPNPKCEKRESNPHGLSPTGLSSQRVYHSAILTGLSISSESRGRLQTVDEVAWNTAPSKDRLAAREERILSPAV